MVVDPAGGCVEWVTTAVRIADKVLVIADSPVLATWDVRSQKMLSEQLLHIAVFYNTRQAFASLLNTRQFYEV
jgi:hypothetical protein